MFQNKRSLGFTFIEIMIVITIIATLASVAFFSYVQFSKKSRDTLRLSNVKEVQGGLEVYAMKTKKYPTPDTAVTGNISYNGNSFPYSKVGFVKENVSKTLNLKSVPLDPIYQKEIQYATLDNGKRYQLSTVLESMFSANNHLTKQTYATSQIAKLEGNYNGRFIKVSSGSTHTVIALPSLFLNNGSGSLNITVNQPVQNILVSGAPGTIDILNNTSGNTFSYTPKVIYSSNKCGVETDQEIVDFLLNLRDAYNQAPFTGLDEFKDIFSDYDSIGANGKSAQDLKMAMQEIDFSTLERIGSKINDALGCEIKSFKTTDIFPETCVKDGVTESGDFEGYPHGYSMTGSCLFSVTGNGTKEVRNNIGKGNSKGMYLKATNDGQGIRVRYTTFSYIPAKLSFDFQTFFASAGYGGLSLYINNTLYDSWGTTNNGNNIKTYTTEVMPPGLYTFEFRVGGATYMLQDWVILDNIVFGCKRMGELSGESNCGWTLDFEDGSKLPWELFTFTGEVKTPWPRDNSPGASNNGNYALTSPNYMVSYKSFSMTRTEVFDQPSKYNFDYKGLFGSSWSGDDVKLIFKINGIDYLTLSSKDTSLNNYKTFSSPLLPAGTYNFEWRISRGNTSQNVKYYLDNIRKSCIGGGAGCGRTLGFENGNTTPSDLFTFTGFVNIPWPIETKSTNTTQGTQSIYSPPFLGCGGHTSLIRKESFTEKAKYNFDFKEINYEASGGGIQFQFYINNILYYSYNTQVKGEGEFKTLATPLLNPGDYTFEWRIKRECNWQLTSFYFDNFRKTCEGGGPGCGIQTDTNGSTSFEAGDTPLTDLFTFTGTVKTPWNIVNSPVSNGSLALQVPNIGAYTSTQLIMNRTLTQAQKISFDARHVGFYANVRFYINNIEYKRFTRDDPTTGSFANYTSPLLPPGNYEFKWEVIKDGDHPNGAVLTLDNLQFTCIGGGSGCGILVNSNNATSFESGNTPLTDLFIFTGSVRTPWNIVNSPVSNGTLALQVPNIGAYTSTQLIMNRSLTQAQKISFDARHVGFYANVRFYINNIEYKRFTRDDPTTGSFANYTSPLLPPGNYEFKWEVIKDGDHPNGAVLTLDNLQFTCIGGGTGCGITANASSSTSFEAGNTPLTDLFIFTGSVRTPWNIVNSPVSNGTLALQVPNIGAYTSTQLIMNRSLTQAQKISFDARHVGFYANVQFFINNVQYRRFDRNNPGSTNYVNYTSTTLPPGNYEFKWVVIKDGDHPNGAVLTLDNLQFID